jgi:uncharacterized membrane protein
VDQTIFMLAFVLPVIFCIGGLLIILAAMRQYGQKLEMKHRERMAMIEKGIAPSPSSDPATFETWQQRHENPPVRSTSIGIMFIAIGLGFMLIVGFAGGTRGPAIGIGGAIVVVGAAFLVNGELQRRSRPPSYGRDAYTVTPPQRPSDPTVP